MKLRNYILNNIEECEKENFETVIIFDNIHRGKILAIIMIVFELIFSIADISSSYLQVDNRFLFNEYLVMYTIMIFFNILYLLLTRKFEKINDATFDQLKKYKTGMVLYITLIMSWGSAVTLMDQKLYGNLIVFMINMIICSVIYFLDNRSILIPYFFSTLVLIIGLPLFQSSKDILIGHYVNLIVFISISWIASRIIYTGYCNDFNSKVLLEKANILLEKEIKENKRINMKLTKANLQLKEAALIDELTGIQNRRSFRNYIDTAFENYVKNDSDISVLMIDIDFFKQFNDNYGHEKGDKVLIEVANQINSVISNPMEFFGRWGGEEFIYVAFNAKKDDVGRLAENIMKRVYDLGIPHEFSEKQYLSVSIGTCTIRITGREDVSKAIELADRALYTAKNSGRNCVKSNVYNSFGGF